MKQVVLVIGSVVLWRMLPRATGAQNKRAMAWPNTRPLYVFTTLHHFSSAFATLHSVDLATPLRRERVALIPSLAPPARLRAALGRRHSSLGPSTPINGA